MMAMYGIFIAPRKPMCGRPMSYEKVVGEIIGASCGMFCCKSDAPSGKPWTPLLWDTREAAQRSLEVLFPMNASWYEVKEVTA
jgi:hypothetical protein